MNILRISLLAIISLASLAGCNRSGVTSGMAERPDIGAAPAEIDTELSKKQVAAVTAITRAPSPPSAARASVSQLDTTTVQQKAAAAKAPEVAETRLGSTVASLGDPTQGGLWVKTPLVDAPGIGRIVNSVNGKSAKVDLIPLGGPDSAGSQVSLSALQLIGVSLTELPLVEVYRF